MKATGRTLYVSGAKTHLDIETDNNTNPATYNSGLIPIWENERRGYGYIVRYVAPFPSISGTEAPNPWILTTYSKRDCRKLREGGTAGGNQVLKILGVQAGIHPAANDRVLAVCIGQSVSLSNLSTLKVDSLVVQSLSLGIDSNKGVATYYIELEEYLIDENEQVLALLGESDQNMGNFTVAV